MKHYYKVIKRICLLLVLLAALFPLASYAQGNSGTIHIVQKDNDTKQAVSGISLTLYRVADSDGKGGYRLTSDFEKSSVTMDSIYDERSQEVVRILDEFIGANDKEGLCTKITDGNGAVLFAGLADGLYFVKQTNMQSDFEKLGYSYETKSYLIALPRTDENGYLTRTVECQPKGELKYNEEYVDIAVYKVWKDNSNSAGKRPESISAGLYCNGELKEKVTLDAGNNWTHRWKNLDSSAEWSIKEIGVPKGYVSEVTSEGSDFVITNKLSSPPGDSEVRTGDNGHEALYSVLMIGAVLMILVLVMRRKENE